MDAIFSPFPVVTSASSMGAVDCFVNTREPAASVTSQSRKRTGLFTNSFFTYKATKVTFPRIHIRQKRILTIRRISNLPKKVQSSNVVEFELRHIPKPLHSNRSFTHDDQFANRYANMVSILVCKPIVMSKQSNSLFSNRSSIGSQESNV